jgi:hypothetical protein
MCPNCNCNCNCNIPEHAFSPNPNVSPELSVTTIFEFRHCAIQFQDWASSFETERFPSTGCNIYISWIGELFCLLYGKYTPIIWVVWKKKFTNPINNRVFNMYSWDWWTFFFTPLKLYMMMMTMMLMMVTIENLLLSLQL